MKKKLLNIILIITLVLSLAGCLNDAGPNNGSMAEDSDIQTETIYEPGEKPATSEVTKKENPKKKETENKESKAPVIDLNSIPAYSGKPYIAINDNIPYFSESDYTTSSFETYNPLDSLGRCGVAFANIGKDIMPTEDRGNIGAVKPSGWHTVKYDNVDGKYLYNRCHLIGFQLSGENANEKNLITGTRYLNVNGMLPFENMVADYVKETNNHVLYRITPVFKGNDLLATGVLMEALSMEDDGEGICFNVFCYNEQPGIIIDHSTGESKLNETPVVVEKEETVVSEPTASYVANKNTKKFHYSSCYSIKQMKEENKEYLNYSRNQVISLGYSPCKNCNP